jgi:glycosyltransferase involved in cell wall biosynthesis
MVFKIKENSGESKGILIFRELELNYLEGGHDLSNRRWGEPTMSDLLEQLASTFIIGVHWGRYNAIAKDPQFVDFHMAAPGSIGEFKSDDYVFIPLSARNFTPTYFEPLDIPNRWDILTIGHLKRDKQQVEILEALKHSYKSGGNPSALFICPTMDRVTEYETEFWKKYDRLFTDSEKENIDIFTPQRKKTEKGLAPIPNEFFPYLYNCSKVFALFSKEEGGSRCVSESLLCGTPVIVRNELRGGATDYLDYSNSFSFESIEEAGDIFNSVVSGSPKFNPEYLRSELVESSSISQLKRQIQTLFQEQALLD